MELITNPKLITDLTAFELFLIEKGFEMRASSTYFNSYNGCSRNYQKEGYRVIAIGLCSGPHDSTTRIGVTTFIENDKIAHLPSEGQFWQMLNNHKK